jgi:phage terminase small subunit
MDTKLTHLQESFCQHIVSGMNQAEAYRAAGYTWETMAENTVYQAASRLAADSKIAARVDQLRQPVVAKVAWDLERFLGAAESQRLAAVATDQLAAANGALKLIGDATGLLDHRSQQDTGIQVTRVTVVLNTGQPADGVPLPASQQTKVLQDSQESE